MILGKNQGIISNRIIAIGDIHGCARALAVLIRSIQPNVTDTIVVLGDVIDYGPDSKSVIHQLLGLKNQTNLVVVRGNHEELLLGAVDGSGSVDHWTPHGGEATLKSYGVEHPRDIPGDHLDLIRQSRFFWETPDNIFVHAGYYPNHPLDTTPSSVLFWDFMEPERAWPHFSEKTVIVGHTPQLSGEILDRGFLVCIDTNCSRGGWLTGLDVVSGHYWQANELGQIRERDRDDS